MKSHDKLYNNLSVSLIALNAAINLRAKLASQKLHCADFRQNLPKITATAKKSWHTSRTTVFTVIP